jgi:hypothetical protein
MQYLTREDGSIPPDVDVAALIAAGIRIVRPTPIPRSPGMVAIEGAPEDRDGEWWQTWIEQPAPPPALPPVPATITPLQARRSLRSFGLMDDVEAALAVADDDTREAWEYAIEIHRDDPVLLALAEHIGITSDMLDDLFRDAARR